MHKKPIYSFENKDSLGIMEAPLLSVIAIEDTEGLDPELEVKLPQDQQALVIIIAKNGLTSASTIKDFISNPNNWMWFYNGGIEDRFVKREGDTMYGDLAFVTADGETAANATVLVDSSSGSITAKGDVTVYKNLLVAEQATIKGSVTLGSLFAITDYDDNLTKGIISFVRDGNWYLDKHMTETNNIKIKIENKEVLTEVTGVLRTDWATPTTGGIFKARRVGNVLYMTTNGNNA